MGTHIALKGLGIRNGVAVRTGAAVIVNIMLGAALRGGFLGIAVLYFLGKIVTQRGIFLSKGLGTLSAADAGVIIGRVLGAGGGGSKIFLLGDLLIVGMGGNIHFHIAVIAADIPVLAFGGGVVCRIRDMLALLAVIVFILSIDIVLGAGIAAVAEEPVGIILLAVGCLAAQVGSGQLLLYIVVTQRLADGEGLAVFLKLAAAAGFVIGGCIGAIRSGDEVLIRYDFEVVMMDMRLLIFADIPADGAVFCGLLCGGRNIPCMGFAVVFGAAEGADMIVLIGVGIACQIVSGEAVRADCLALEIEVINMGKSFVGGSAADRAGFPVGIVGLAVGGFGSQILGVFQINKCMLRIIAEFRAALVADRFLGAGGGGGGAVFLGCAAVIIAADGAALLVGVGSCHSSITEFMVCGAKNLVAVGADLIVGRFIDGNELMGIGVVADPVNIDVMDRLVICEAVDRFGKGLFAAFIKVACHVLLGRGFIGTGFDIQFGITDGNGAIFYGKNLIGAGAVIGKLEGSVDGKVKPETINGSGAVVAGVADGHGKIDCH